MHRTARAIVPLMEPAFEERPCERLLSEGPCSLPDAELLTLLLRVNRQGAGRLGLAQRLLERFGGVLGVLDQDGPALMEVEGVGAARAAAVVAARELVARAELARLKRGAYVAGSKAMKRFLRWRLAGLQREVFGLILLNARNAVLAVEYLFYGSVDRSVVYTREIVKCCLRHNAAAVVLFHNHPSGEASPSEQDKAVTERVFALLEEINVALLDHVIVGGAEQVSMAEEGLVPQSELC